MAGAALASSATNAKTAEVKLAVNFMMTVDQLFLESLVSEEVD